jgi:alpha,alpha-trehalose-phosphate synthase [UDP-forming]
MSQLTVVANRLPVQPPPFGNGLWSRSPGGLVAALHALLAVHGGTWVGSTGADCGESLPTDLGYRLQGVSLDEATVRGFYDGFSNATLWPLYHNLASAPVYERQWWVAYRRANEAFADVVARSANHDSSVWIQDYHLQLVPAMLRERRPDLRIGFFLHTPFPAPDLFTALPWRREIIQGLGGAHVLGFQTADDADNFRNSAARIAERSAESPPVIRRRLPARADVGVFPISIDWDHWQRLASSPATAARARELRAQLGSPRHVLVGVDRLDYTKGLEQRLVAFRELLRDGAFVAPETAMVQIAVPSRDGTAAHRDERARIEQLVGEINGTFGHVGAPVVHFLHRACPPEEIAALYRAADVMVVTPVKDGMNLVAKEFVASRVDGAGVLVLSEFAGAARELTDALLVNPHDVDGLKAALLNAVAMPRGEAERRMRSLRAAVAAHTVQDWAASFMGRLVPALAA